jgi:hypothetical protein
MRRGPISQLRISELTRSLRSAAILPIWEYRTLARTGYIIARSPMAIGNETLPIFTASNQSFRFVKTVPSKSPATIASPRFRMCCWGVASIHCSHCPSGDLTGIGPKVIAI